MLLHASPLLSSLFFLQFFSVSVRENTRGEGDRETIIELEAAVRGASFV